MGGSQPVGAAPGAQGARGPTSVPGEVALVAFPFPRAPRRFSRASQNAKVSSECQPRAAVGDESGAGTPKPLVWELAPAGGLDRFRHRPVVHEEARMVQELSNDERGGA